MAFWHTRSNYSSLFSVNRIGRYLSRAPVGDKGLGALLYPSLLLTLLFALFIGAVALAKPQWLSVFKEVLAIKWGSLLNALVPPLVLIFLVLGTIFIGLATPTEAGAMGAAGAHSGYC
ncbi:MAG: TRAP transporter large permease subunit [Moraxellaceae bacterium]|nr:TRAP transporter large permease subunit [Moraxellaceae bacterium]